MTCCSKTEPQLTTPFPAIGSRFSERTRSSRSSISPSALSRSTSQPNMPREGRGNSDPRSGRHSNRRTHRGFDTTNTGRMRKAEKGQRIHGCIFCGKVYTRNEHLSRHQQNHASGRYRCDSPGCDKSFHEGFYLEKHKVKEWPFNFPQPSHSSTRSSSHGRGRVEVTPEASQRPLSETSGDGYQSASSGADEYGSSPTPAMVSNRSYLSPSPVPDYFHRPSSHHQSSASPQAGVAAGRNTSASNSTPRLPLSSSAPPFYTTFPPQAVPASGHSYPQTYLQGDPYASSQNIPPFSTSGLRSQYGYIPPDQPRQQCPPPTAPPQTFHWQESLATMNSHQGQEQNLYNMHTSPATHYSHTLPHQGVTLFSSQESHDHQSTNYATPQPGYYPDPLPHPIPLHSFYYLSEGRHESTPSHPAPYEHTSESGYHSTHSHPAYYTITPPPGYAQGESENVPFHPRQQSSYSREASRHLHYDSSH